MRNLPPGYSIHTGTNGRLQAWFHERPVTPDMWWDPCEMHYIRQECLNDAAKRTATNLEETTQKYLALYQAGQSDYLRQVLNCLNLGVYNLQAFVCTLLCAVERSTRDAQENTGWDRKVDKQLVALNKRILAIVVILLQELQVDIPRHQKWSEEINENEKGQEDHDKRI